MKERESLSILLLFPARTLQFNINIIRKRKGRTVNGSLKTVFILSLFVVKHQRNINSQNHGD